MHLKPERHIPRLLRRSKAELYGVVREREEEEKREKEQDNEAFLTMEMEIIDFTRKLIKLSPFLLYAAIWMLHPSFSFFIFFMIWILENPPPQTWFFPRDHYSVSMISYPISSFLHLVRFFITEVSVRILIPILGLIPVCLPS